MKDSSTDQVIQKLKYIEELYHRLILIVGPSGSGKTNVLRELRTKLKAPILNISMELSRKMLDLTGRQRILSLARLLQEIVDECQNEIVLFDNTEILFDPNLKQDPLKILQNLSRKITVISSWNGSATEKHLMYAVPNHTEYRKYTNRNLIIINLEDNSSKRRNNREI